MVYGLIEGGLGNCMFVIATGITLAQQKKCEFIAIYEELATFEHGKSKELYYQQFRNNIFRNIKLQKGIPENSYLYVDEVDKYKLRYHPIPYQPNILLKGDFMSPKYFDEELILKTFGPNEYLKNIIEQTIGKDLFYKLHTATSINVRRGDYLKLPLFLPVLHIQYFKKAIKYIGNKETFIVTSNDIPWCKKKFKGANFIFIENTTPDMDLYIQSLCKNNILSNGTFSWWGAYLNTNPTKKVIIPSIWFGKGLPYDTIDFLPQEWIKIKNPPVVKVRIANLRFTISQYITRHKILRKIYKYIK